MIVRDLMSSPPIIVSPGMSLADAAHLMKSRGIRRLPVVDGECLVGIVTDRDLREAMPSVVSTLSPWEATTRLAATEIEDVMRRNLLTTLDETDARDAAYTMLKHKVGGLPVLSPAGALVGLLTVSDVLRDYARVPESTSQSHEQRRRSP